MRHRDSCEAGSSPVSHTVASIGVNEKYWLSIDHTCTGLLIWPLTSTPLPPGRSIAAPTAGANPYGISPEPCKRTAADSAVHGRAGLPKCTIVQLLAAAAYRAACKVDAPSVPAQVERLLLLSPLVFRRLVHRSERSWAHSLHGSSLMS